MRSFGTFCGSFSSPSSPRKFIGLCTGSCFSGAVKSPPLWPDPLSLVYKKKADACYVLVLLLFCIMFRNPSFPQLSET